jgi:hypothetical protein
MSIIGEALVVAVAVGEEKTKLAPGDVPIGERCISLKMYVDASTSSNRRRVDPSRVISPNITNISIETPVTLVTVTVTFAIVPPPMLPTTATYRAGLGLCVPRMVIVTSEAFGGNMTSDTASVPIGSNRASYRTVEFPATEMVVFVNKTDTLVNGKRRAWSIVSTVGGNVLSPTDVASIRLISAVALKHPLKPLFCGTPRKRFVGFRRSACTAVKVITESAMDRTMLIGATTEIARM